MTILADYQNKYAFAAIERSEKGVLTVTMSTDGGSWVFSNDAHARLGFMFEDIAADPETKVVLFTGAWGHAERLAALPELVLRYTRAALTQRIKRRMLAEAPQGYALISLAALENVAA